MHGMEMGITGSSSLFAVFSAARVQGDTSVAIEATHK
jgi:hypothetical protein